ncbi:unnamed protein product [Notodromas monacha]|uniref:Uncharacterized protein n=1 Tax=Notodromas monacha TaxID=399045 RepID=A0A7R9BCC2_9CRUS|nr:unnamed protein product [Notodromas monacha]CAG0912671.1 unnamed protein product [Notodromas monacha]
MGSKTSNESDVTRVVNELLGASVPSIARLNEIELQFEEEKAELEAGLEESSRSSVNDDSSERLKETVENTLRDLRKLKIDQEKLIIDAEKALEEGEEQFKILFPMVTKGRAIRRARSYKAIVEQVQARVVEMSNSVARQNYVTAVESYKCLADMAKKCVNTLESGDEKRVSHLRRYLLETTSSWYKFLKTHIVKELDDSLTALKWPFSETSGNEIPWTTEHVQKFEAVFLLAAKLCFPPPNTQELPTLPIRVMLKPLTTRFKFHFTGTKETNNREKPEWFLTQILKWAKDCLPFMEQVAGKLQESAPTEFLEGLVELAVEKLYLDLTSYADEYDDDVVLAHCIEEALLFDKELRFLCMLLSITDRYRCLVQPGHRLQFAELQVELAEDFRVRLVQLARDERKDPVNSKLCPILNTISYILQVILEWSDLPLFVELQFYKEKTFPNVMSCEFGVDNNRVSGLFDEVIELLQHSEDDLVSTLHARVGEEISAQALEYKRDRWFATNVGDKYKLSGSACSFLDVIRGRLRVLKLRLNESLFRKIAAKVATDVAKFLVDDLACEVRFSVDGGRQLGIDLQRGFIVVFTEFDKKLSKYFRAASEAVFLLNLPKGSAILLRDELNTSRSDELKKNSLRELDIHRLTVFQAVKILDNRLSLELIYDEKKQDKNSWIEAWKDPLASLYTFSSCMSLCDLYGDGDSKLIIADLGTGLYNMKLKVYKGTALETENTLVDLPTSVVTFQMETMQPRIPAIAVASAAYVYIYKNLRPYFKFTLPPLEINPIEEDLWKQAEDDQISFPALREMLEGLRQEVGEMSLTTRSQRFLMITDGPSMARFVSDHKAQPLKKQTVITCMTVLKKSHADSDAIACLVLGTESSLAFVLDPEAFTILAAISLPGVPTHLHVTGLFDVEFRFVLGCRDGSIAMVKRGDDEAATVAKCSVPPVGVHIVGKTIVVPCMDNSIRCYSLLGNILWHLTLSASILCSELIEVRQLDMTAVAVGLSDGSVLVYKDKALVDSFKIHDGVSSMKFGRFGREDNTLVIVTRGGGLIVKMLRRQARLEPLDDDTSAQVSQQSLKLNVPKKTKLFVDQTVKEREDPIGMHRAFQQDLYRLRLKTARAFVESLEKCANPISSDRDLPVALGAQVIGLGPTFRIRIDVTNTSCDKSIRDLAVTFNYDEKLYKVDQHYIRVQFFYVFIEKRNLSSINTLSTKWADKIDSKNSAGQSAPFVHPFLQATGMFLGETSCLLAFFLIQAYLKWQKPQTENERLINEDGAPVVTTVERRGLGFNPFIFLPPALCDMTATSIMYIGLNLTYASSFQMLRGAVIVFTGMLSVAFLSRLLSWRQWGGIFAVIAGLAVVGASDFVSPSTSASDRPAQDVITGDALILIAQIIAAVQMVYEEKFVSKHNVPPLLAVGFEGLFGLFVLSSLLVPMYFIKVGEPFSSNPRGVLEDALDAFTQLSNSTWLSIAFSGTIISIAFFNFAGVSVTKDMSATTRMVLDSVRTLVIWAVSLALGWQPFFYLQAMAGRGRAARLRSVLDAARESPGISGSVDVTRLADTEPGICDPTEVRFTQYGRGQLIREFVESTAFAAPQTSVVGLAASSTLNVNAEPFRCRGISSCIPRDDGSSSDFNGETEDTLIEVRTQTESLDLSSDPCVPSGTRKHLPVLFQKGSLPVEVAANYVKLHFKPNFGIFEYSVSFTPGIDDSKARRSVLDRLSELTGDAKLFDGSSMLLLPKRISSEASSSIVKSVVDSSSNNVEVKLDFLGEKPLPRCLRWYNALFKLVQKDLDMIRVGRNFFAYSQRRSVPEYHLEVWPGFISAVHFYDEGLVLCLDISHRVLRTETVHELISSVEQSLTFKNKVEAILLKQVVMTRYNNCTHIVHDIAWGETPNNTFVTRAGRCLTYVQYYKIIHDIDIQDVEQPLLICRQKRMKSGVESTNLADLVRLIPELCYMTGLSENMRCNHSVMKSISRYNKPGAEERKKALMDYVSDLNTNEKARKRLEDWGLVLDTNLVRPNVRILDQPRVRVGPEMSTRVEVFDVNGRFKDWASKLGEFGVIHAVPLLQWVVIAPVRMRTNMQKFIEAYVKRMGAYLRAAVAHPTVKYIQQDSVPSYLSAIAEFQEPDVQLFLIGFMSQRDDKYQAVKKMLCKQMPRPSQCILNRTLSKDTIAPIVNKIALQINCKLGGELWAVEHSTKGAMFVGIDVYHDQYKRNESILGFVSSSNESATQYYAQVCKYQNAEKNAEQFRVFLANGLEHWRLKNFGNLPKHVIVFRDGLMEAKMTSVMVEEAAAMKETRNRPAANPIPGTAVDGGVTRNHNFQDFFLVSQFAKEGTVSPTHYVIVENKSNFRIDEIQALTYRMTYMYYNWTGSIRETGSFSVALDKWGVRRVLNHSCTMVQVDSIADEQMDVDASGPIVSRSNLPWVEKYRPTKLDELIAHEDILKTISKFMREGTLPHLLFYGPPGTGKTSTILACAKMMYSPKQFSSMVLELNASDDRGINVVRTQVLSFASTKTIFKTGLKLIILDEADAMTNDAQNALRRIIEKFTDNVRFCMICNYLSKIIPALQSRCTRFRFGPLSTTQMIPRMRDVIESENIKVTEEGLQSVVELAEGDMRKALNLLQSCSMAFPEVNAETTYTTLGHPTPQDVLTIMNWLLNADFSVAVRNITDMKISKGFALVDILTQLHKYVHRLEIPSKSKIYLIDKMAEVENRLSFGGSEKIQLSSLVSAFFTEELQQQIIKETFQLVSKRDDNVCNFLEGGSLIGGSDFKLAYRHYATLYFVFCVDSSESELGILDLIQVFVETLDKCFENVCELDLIFHVDKVHYILNELVMGGMVLETNVSEIVSRIEEQNKLEKDEAGLSAAPARAVSAVKNLNISQQIKDMKLPDLPAAIKDLNLKL